MSKFSVLVVAWVCLVAVACAGLPASPTPAAAPSPAPLPTTPPTRKSGTLRLLYLNTRDVRDVPVLLALEALQAQGYTIVQTSLGTTSLIVDALARGDGDLASFANNSAWTAVSKGAKLVTIGEIHHTQPVVAARNDIHTCQDLDGKPVAVNPPGQANAALLDRYMKQSCPGAKYVPVVISDNAAKVAALQSGNVDAALVENEFMLDIQRRAPDRFHALISLAKEFPLIHTAGIQVRREWAEQNPGLVKDYMRALLESDRRVAADRQLLYAEAQKRIGLDAAAAKETADMYLDNNAWEPNGGLTAENVKYTLDFLTGLSAVPAGLKVEDVSDLSYLNAALDAIGRK